MVLNPSKYGKKYVFLIIQIQLSPIRSENNTDVLKLVAQPGLKQATGFLRTVTAASDLIDITLVNYEFGVRMSVMFHLMVVHIIFSSVWALSCHLFGAAHSLDHMFSLYFDSVILVISLLVLGVLIAPVPDHWILVTFPYQLFCLFMN